MALLQYWTGTAWADIDNTTTLKVQQLIGFDAVPVKPVSRPYGLSTGDVYQRTRTEARTMTAILLAIGTSLSNLHAVKDALGLKIGIDAWGSISGAAITLRYNGASTPRKITAYYAGGMEGAERPIANLKMERIALRFFCPDPGWVTI